MHHAFQSFYGAVDSFTVFRSETCDYIACSIVNITDSIDRCNSTDLNKAITTGKCSYARFHGSVIAFELSYCCSGARTVIALFKRLFVCIPDSLDTHMNIRKSLWITYRQIIKRCSANDWYYDIITGIESDLSVCKFSHNSGSGFQSESRTSAEYNSIDSIYSILTSQKIRLSCSRASASDVHSTDSTLFTYDYGAACTLFLILCVAEPKTPYIGNADYFHSHMISLCSLLRLILFYYNII